MFYLQILYLSNFRLLYLPTSKRANLVLTNILNRIILEFLQKSNVNKLNPKLRLNLTNNRLELLEYDEHDSSEIIEQRPTL